MNYRDYLTSQLWMKRKRLYFESHQRKCRACGSTKKIHLHHKTYKRLGEERDADLVPLCHICHLAVHRKQRSSGQSLWTTTEDFIRLKKKKYKNSRVVKKRQSLKRKTPRR